jgi:ribosomal protein S12
MKVNAFFHTELTTKDHRRMRTTSSALSRCSVKVGVCVRVRVRDIVSPELTRYKVRVRVSVMVRVRSS